MAYNDMSLSDRILNLTNAASNAVNQAASSYQNRKYQTEQIALQKAKYLQGLDDNVYSASADKALKGIESMFYGNSKTGVNGFFKDQLNDSNYENYELSTTTMLDSTLSVDYLMKNYGMTASHAERFINDYSDTIRGEAIQRTQTNTWMAMSSYLGADQESYTALMAETGTSVTEQWTLSKDHYYENGGPSWDITGEHNPDRIENKLNFGYNWAISSGKTIVDSGLTTIGMTTEELVELAMGKFDEAMSEMGDGSNLSNATISASRTEYEKYIRSYISQQSGFAYDESDSKYLTASVVFADAYENGRYIDDETFNNLIKDCNLDETNVYDLAMINKLKLEIATLNEKTIKSASDPSINYPSFYNDYLLNPLKTNDDCKAELSSMYIAHEIDEATYNELLGLVESRNNPFIEEANGIIDAVRAGLVGTEFSPYLEYKLKSDPGFYKQIYNTCLSNPDWGPNERRDYISGIVADFNSEEVATKINDMLTYSFGEATGYSFVIGFTDDTNIYDLRAEYYSGNNNNLLRPEYAEQIESAIINGQFSNKDDLLDSVSALLNGGKKYDELNAYEKNELMFNVAIVGLNSMEFGRLSSKLDALYGDEDYNIRQIDIYGYGAGGVDEEGNVYYLTEDDQLYIGKIPFTKETYNAMFGSKSEYGIQIYPSEINSFKSIDVKPQEKTDPVVEEYAEDKAEKAKDNSWLGLASKVGQAAMATSAGVPVGSLNEGHEATALSEKSREQSINIEKEKASEEAVDDYWSEKNKDSWTLGNLWQRVAQGVSNFFSADDGGLSDAFALAKKSEEAKKTVTEKKVTTEQQKIFYGALNSLRNTTVSKSKDIPTYETK